MDEGKIILAVKVKEFKTSWKTDIQDLGSLTGVYETQVIVDETLGKISIEVGDDKIEEVIEAFLTYRLAIPLIPYTIGVLMHPILSQTVRQKNYVNF